MFKILLMFNRFDESNGVARAAIALANNLAERGDCVTLMPLYRCDKSTTKYLNKNVTVHPVFGFYISGFSKFLDFFPPSLLYKFIVKEQYDIEIAFQYGQSVKILSHSSNKQAKHLTWMHGYDYGLKLRKFYPRFEKVICVSKFNAKRFQKEMNSTVPVDYCYNTIDDVKVRELGAESLSQKRPVEILLVSVGRFTKEKGYPRLVECAIRLLKEGQMFYLWLIGDGPELELCRKKVSDNQLQKYIIFWGAQSNPHKYTSKADVFICPSFSEGYSNACTESIMLGVPVISTAVSGAEEIIEESKSGMVVENSENGLYMGLKHILENKESIKNWKDSINETSIFFSKRYRCSKLYSVIDESKN